MKKQSSSIFSWINEGILSLNTNKFFAGICLILLNIGSKFITIQFSKSTEEYLKMIISKQLLVFTMAWMGTRDIYAALSLTAIFTILSDYAFNEESNFCVVPEKYRVLKDLIDTDNDGNVSDTEMADAIRILEKAKQEKLKSKQKEAFTLFDHERAINNF
jgi:hypothetical protein